MANNDQPQESLTQDEIAALQSWSSMGSPGAAPTTPYIPSDEQRSRLQLIKQPRTIPVDWHFGLDAYHKFKYGHRAHEQEDKWNIYLEDNALLFHRSWTGNEIFRFALSPIREMHVSQDQSLQDYKHYAVTSFEVEQDPEVYKATDDQQITNELLAVLKGIFGVSPIPIARPEQSESTNQTPRERTANSTEIADEVASYLDYMNAVKDISDGLQRLTPRYVIDEAQAPVKEIADGLAYYIFDGGSPSAFRKSLIGASQAHPKPARYIIVRTHSQNPANEKAPYLQAFWVVVPHGSELGATIDDNYDRRVEPLTKGHYSGLDHKLVNEQFGNTIFDAFAPRSKYERSFWLPTKKFTTPSLVMFAYLKEDKRPDGWENTKDRTPMMWFAKDFKTSTLVGSAYSKVATLYPEFKADQLKPMKVHIPEKQAFEAWRKDLNTAADAYFNGSTLDKEVARMLFLSLPSVIPPEYQKWVVEYFGDFWKFLRSHFLDTDQTQTEQKEPLQ